ncbi:MAG: nitrophenyl compound nitroreductase subunit ArsF family protein [Desulfobacula sp.]|nr:nitrophenyl compound nitroreductase subunit ArsF family protein [Desulfobacula sp.]
MKKSIVLLFAILLSSFAFSQNEEAHSKKSQIDIYYFHKTQRCQTCLSIEENTKITLDLYFENELKDGSIKFICIDYEDGPEKELIEKYMADSPALYLTKTKKGKETKKDLTDFAFDNSLHKPDKFKSGLRDKINKLLR